MARLIRAVVIGWICLLELLNCVRAQSIFDSIIHPDSLQQLVEVLAADSFQGRLTRSKGALEAAHFIASEFKRAGALPLAGNNGYFMPVSRSVGNVIAALPGKSDEVVIFCAHYDHIGTVRTNPYQHADIKTDKEIDSIFNGANDNASGVSAVIILARYFGKINSQERTLVFAAFTGEELGLLGSKMFVERLSPQLVKAVINIEMLGGGVDKITRPYITGSRYSDLRKILNSRLFKNKEKLFGKTYFNADLFSDHNLFTRSDNYSFAKQGIPAHTIMATHPTDKYYHSLDDEANTLNYKSMSKIIEAIAISCSGLVMGTDTPGRIKYR